MSLLTRLKPLFSSLRLFVPEAEMDIPRTGSKYPGLTPTTGKKQMKKPDWKRISSVMSSLALGERGGWHPWFVCFSLSLFHYGTSLTYHGSHWSGV